MSKLVYASAQSLFYRNCVHTLKASCESKIVISIVILSSFEYDLTNDGINQKIARSYYVQQIVVQLIVNLLITS